MHTFAILAYIIVAAVAVILALMLKRQLAAAGFEARREAAELELLQTRLEITRKARERAEEAAGPWNSWRKFRVEKKVHEGGDICSFYLAPHDRKPLPPFRPGQYLTFHFDGIPGQDKPAVRCYSLSDCYYPDHYRISVKRVPAPRDAPDAPPGLGSSFLHDHIEEGALLDVGAPNGNFAIDPEESTPIVLIGGGIGVTPVLSMLNAILQSGSSREVWFFYGIRHASENILVQQLEKLSQDSADYPNVHFRVCYSDKPEAVGELKPYEIAGTRVTVELMKSLLPSNNYEFYTCWSAGDDEGDRTRSARLGGARLEHSRGGIPWNRRPPRRARRRRSPPAPWSSSASRGRRSRRRLAALPCSIWPNRVASTSPSPAAWAVVAPALPPSWTARSNTPRSPAGKTSPPSTRKASACHASVCRRARW